MAKYPHLVDLPPITDRLNQPIHLRGTNPADMDTKIMPKIVGYTSSESVNTGVGSPRAPYQDEAGVLRLLGIVHPVSDEVGKTVSKTGAAMANMGLKLLERERNNEQIVESANAQIEGISQLGNLYKEVYSDKVNYHTAADRYESKSKEVVDNILNNISDREVRAPLTKTLGMYRVQHQIELNGHIVEYRQKTNQANLLGNVEKLIDHSGKTELGSNEFNQVVTTGSSMIKAYGVNIGMNPVEVEKLDQHFRGGVSKTQALRIMNQGDDGPQRLIDMVTMGELPDLEPGAREALINTATRRIQAINTRRDADVRRSIAMEDRSDRQVDRLEGKVQDQNFGSLGALIQRRTDSNGNPISTDAIRVLINKAAEERDIRPEHVNKLEGMLHRDYKEDLSTFNKRIDENFSTKGKFEGLDRDNEKYKSRLKIEGEERIRNGERPNDVYQDIEQREQRKTPLTPKAYPTPVMLTGDKENLADLQKAAEKTAMAIEAYNDAIKEGKSKAYALQAGMDPKVGARELKNLRDLINAVNYHNKLKVEREQNQERK